MNAFRGPQEGKTWEPVSQTKTSVFENDLVKIFVTSASVITRCTAILFNTKCFI